MKIYTLLNAVEPLKKIARADFKTEIFYKLRRKIREVEDGDHLGFFVERRQQLGEGADLSELLNFEVEMTPPVVILPKDMPENLELSYMDSLQLEGIVEFPDPDEE